MKQHVNHTIGIVLVLPLLVFFFYKSVLSSNPFDGIAAVTDNIETLQVKLHRDILRYRNNQIRQYDTLNETVQQISSLSSSIRIPASTRDNKELTSMLTALKNSIDVQAKLVEDFKTNNAVLQNSLYYYSRLHSEIHKESSAYTGDLVSDELLGKLSTLILEYTRKPEHQTAMKIYPLLDNLNINLDSELNSLINHSLIIIEKLPIIDNIIEAFNTLDIEKKTKNIENMLFDYQDQMGQHTRIYNSLLFFCSLYLLGYIGFMFIILKQNKNTLLVSNDKLNREVEERTKTEKTLYRLVKETSSIGEKDFVQNILQALHRALGYRYAYLSLVSESGKNSATKLGLVDNGRYQSDIAYKIENSPCEEVLNNGRLVLNSDFQNYFPDWDNTYVEDAESYIGITIKDETDRIIGLLAVADDKAIDNSNLAETILSLAASRTSAELLRYIAQQDSDRYHNGLESIDSWLFELISIAGHTESFYKTVCDAARDIANATMATVPLLDESGEHYIFAAASGHHCEKEAGTCKAVNDGGLYGWVLTNKKELRIDDVSTDMRARRQMINKYDVRSAYVKPIQLNGDIFGAISVFRDSTPFDHIDEQLISQFTQRVQLAIANMHLVKDIAAEKERAEFTLHSIGDAVITTDSEGNIEYMNHIAERLTGWPMSTAQKQSIQDVFRILDHDTREPMHNVIEACLAEGTSISKSMTYLVSRDSGEKSIESSMSPILNRAGSIEGAIIVFHDETERRRMECIIHHQATHDSLTGLINRHQFNIELKEQINHAKTHDTKHVLCYLDLDRFKLVNDTCGHAAGDELLKQVTSRLQTVIRSGDILGRLGGDEFGLILQNCPVEVAVEISEKIINTISNYDFDWEEYKFTIGVSIGIVPINSQTDNLNEVMKHADVACYTAKDLGRRRSYVYDQQDTELIQRHEELHWASRIAEALEQNRFRIHAQSIYPLDPDVDNIAHIEILVRMEDENGHLVAPAAFIPAAERYDLMGAVDQHIIRETFKFITEHNSESICFSINLSGNSLNDDNLSFFIKQCMKEFDIRTSQVCFEITETSAITNLVKTRKLIEDLQVEGFKFALDDFGSGLSSFSYLKNLPVDYLKIDGSFVRDMVDNKIDHAMVAAINQIGHIMNIKTIAEFVENEDIIEQLQRLGVDFAQGYGISRPKPLSDSTFQEMLKQSAVKNGFASVS